MRELSLLEAKDYLLQNILLQLTEPKYVLRPFLAGPPGIGKTTTIYKVAEELAKHGIITHVYVASGTEPFEYFTGLPVIEETENKEKSARFVPPQVITIATKLAQSEIQSLIDSIKQETEKRVEQAKALESEEFDFEKWFQAAMEYDPTTDIYSKIKKTLDGKPLVILFLDDLHVANEAIQRYMFTLLTSKSIHSYKLPDNVVIVAAGNISEEAGFEGLLSPVMNRLEYIRVTMPLKDWFKLPEIEATVHPLVKAFLNSHPGYFIEQESTLEPFGTPRSWHNFGMRLMFMEQMYAQMYGQAYKVQLYDAATKLASGYMSKEAASQFSAFIQIFKEEDPAKLLRERQLHKMIEQILHSSYTVKSKTLSIFDASIFVHEAMSAIETKEDIDYFFDILDKALYTWRLKDLAATMMADLLRFSRKSGPAKAVLAKMSKEKFNVLVRHLNKRLTEFAQKIILSGDRDVKAFATLFYMKT